MHTSAPLPSDAIVETDTPARLDRLPWGRFHTLVVVALGVTWILDGLEVTLAGALAGALKQSPMLHFSNADVGLAGSAYLTGAVLGAIFITLLPYGIDSLFDFLPRSWRFGATLFGVQVGAVGLCIILFLLFEPKGLAEIWRRIEIYFDRWPFKYRPLDATRR